MNDPAVIYEIFPSSRDEDWHGTMQKKRRQAPIEDQPSTIILARGLETRLSSQQIFAV
jgi:hypothetical protein